MVGIAQTSGIKEPNTNFFEEDLSVHHDGVINIHFASQTAVSSASIQYTIDGGEHWASFGHLIGPISANEGIVVSMPIAKTKKFNMRHVHSSAIELSWCQVHF